MTKRNSDTVEIGEKFSDRRLTKDDYEIARLAWEEGLSLTTILERMNKKHSSLEIMRVRRSLQKAVAAGVLQLLPRQELALRDKLKAKFDWLHSVHVEVDKTAVLLRAARLIQREIETFFDGPDGVFVCANAGGTTIRDMVKFLDRLAPRKVPAEKQLFFLSLNAAEHPEEFGHCANYLCVRLAEIFAAKHIAVVSASDEEQGVNYRRKLRDANLVISAAGGENGFLGRWFRQQGEVPPKDFVGDVCFHPLKKDGNPLVLRPRAKNLLMEKLKPAPEWQDLHRINNHEKLLLILTQDKQKLLVSRALFDAGFPRRCVLESGLALELLDDRKG